MKKMFILVLTLALFACSPSLIEDWPEPQSFTIAGETDIISVTFYNHSYNDHALILSELNDEQRYYTVVVLENFTDQNILEVQKFLNRRGFTQIEVKN